MDGPARVTEGGHPVVGVVVGVVMIHRVVSGGAVAKINLRHFMLGSCLRQANRECSYSCHTALDKCGEIAVGTQNANLRARRGPVVVHGLAGGVRRGNLLHSLKKKIMKFRVCLECKKRPGGSDIDIQVCNHIWRSPCDVFFEPLSGSNETIFLTIP